MLRIFIRRFLLIVYFIVVAFFLAACFSPFLNPSTWWFFGFLGLIFPYLLVTLLLFLIYWLFLRSRWSLLAIASILLGWKSVSAVFAFHIGRSFNKEKEASALRIMTWNGRGFYPSAEKVTREILNNHLEGMFGLIKTFNPDILAIQEFSFIERAKRFDNLSYLIKMGYPYYYFSYDFVRDKQHYSGTAIFSKYPIIDSAKTQVPQSKGDNVESLLSADVLFNSDTVRIFTGHLQSYRFMQRDYSDLSKIKSDPDERLDASKNIIRKMRVAFEKRGLQADMIRNKLDESQHPEIFCGDLNDVPNSYAYFTVRGNKRDAFTAKGFGFGQTYYSFSSNFMRRLPTLRIDYIFTDPRFKIKQYTRVPSLLSDHIPLVTDVQLDAE
ncbi:MAG TPA: endonuclease/exonuclease/phosphatase family protein [Agriterribacter sp.]|nr:endonuclease/exonuclease/phosphatase family protein [Agriterribacter sp.]